MKKILLLILFITISGAILSQSITNNPSNEELIVLTKAKHDALRKDIEDYKNLLVRYQSLRIEYDITIADLDRQSKVSGKTFEELKKANTRIAYLESEIETLRTTIYSLSEKYNEAEKRYRNSERMLMLERGKVYKLKRQQANVYIWRYTAIFAIICFFIVAGNNS